MDVEEPNDRAFDIPHPPSRQAVDFLVPSNAARCRLTQYSCSGECKHGDGDIFYMRNLLGWPETRLAQHTLHYF